MEDNEYEDAWKADGPLTDAAAEGRKKAAASAQAEFADAFDEDDDDALESAREDGDVDDPEDKQKDAKK